MKYFNFVLLLVLLSVGLVSLGFASKANADRPNQKTVQGARTIDPSESDVVGTPKSLGRSLNMQSATPVIQTMSVGAGSAMINGLSGTYTIPGDFPSLEAFAAVLNFVGVSDNTVVELTNASYLEDPVVFGPHPGQDDYTVTIGPALGVDAVVQFKTTVDEGKGLVFAGARNMFVDGGIHADSASLSLEMAGSYPFPVNDAFGATIYLTGVSKNITVKNAGVKGLLDNAVYANVTDGRPAIFMWADDADGAGMQDLAFDNLTITNATYAFKALQYQWLLDYVVDGLTINNCKIGGAYGVPVAEGGLYETVIDVTFTNNIIDGVDYLQTYWYNGYTEWDYDGGVFYAPGTVPFMYGFGQITGAHFLVMDKGVFDRNIYRNIGSSDVAVGDGILTYASRIYYYNYGMYASPTVVTNNRAYNLMNPGGGGHQIVGFRGPLGYAYHNSVRLTGSTAAGTTTTCLSGATASYNNAFSNELTGGTNNYGVTAGGAFNYNAIYSAIGRYHSGYATPNAAVLGGINVNGTFGPIGFDPDLHITTGPSAAEAIGSPTYIANAGNDVDNEVRDAIAPDAGADEFPVLALTWGPDVLPAGIPIAASIPTGLAQVPNVTVKNNAAVAVTNVSVNLTIAPDGYNQNAVIASIPAGGTALAAFPSWTPATTGARVMTATTVMVGDVNATNDVFVGGTTVAAPVPIVGNYTYTWDAGDEGWTRAIDWVRSNTFTKLGGPYSGYSMVVQRPNLISTYTEGAYANTQGYATTYPGANLLTSPWLDISGLGGTDVYVSFYLSIKLEPDWDCGWMEYTVDGLNWKHLGTLNDPDGINWYSQAVYEYALSSDGATIDEATLELYGLINNGNTVLPITRWASNGGASATGPFGYVFVQLKADPTEYPDLVGAPVIKFRYVAFSDAATGEDPGGWAIDNFYIGSTGATFQGGTISGTVFHDINGNGINDGEPAEAGLDIDVDYFGVPVTTIQTNGSGQYSFDLNVENNGLPGNYGLTVNKPGYAFTLPFGSATAVVNHPSQNNALTQDFGTYEGYVSGVVFEDFDNDASDIESGDLPLAGWTIELRQDSPTGTLVGSAVSDADGEYMLLAPPYGTYYVVEVAQTTVGRLTFPVSGSHMVAISGNSGSPTAKLTGYNVGNFRYGKWTIEVTVDRNGNGLRDAADFVPLPFGTDFSYEVYKDNVLLQTITLGSGNSLNIRSQLDVGTYKVVRVTDLPAGWIQTSAFDEVEFALSTSFYNDTTNYLYFKLVTVSGVKYDDTNGNGVKDGGEPGLAGWTINVSGNGGGSQVTGVDGSYLFTGVGTGVHNVTETAQTGWVATSGPFSFTAASADLSVNNKIYDFGNFKTICVSGMKFRDRNNNGVMDAGEEGLPGWTINMTGQTPVVTGPDGYYEFCGIGAGAYTITEVAQSGWMLTVPVSGQYDITGVSGVDVSDLNFGNFKQSDTTLYRTFVISYFESAVDAKKKLAKPPKIGKAHDPAKNTPNEINLMYEVGTGLTVGIYPTVKKGPPVFWAKSYKEIMKSLSSKGTHHIVGAPPNVFDNRGFDLDIKGKPMLGLLKKVEPKKKNDHLFAQLVMLKMNLIASANGITPIGLGALVYNDAGHQLDGMSIDAIAAYGDDVMTNWGGIGYDTYAMLDTVVMKLNSAFDNGSCDFDSLTFATSTAKYGTVKALGYKAVMDVDYLRYDPNIVPQNRPIADLQQVPDQYALGQNYPNPFNPTTTVEFDLPVDAFVTLKVYNMLGQEVATLVNHEAFYSGTEEVEFDASQLASGVYLYRIVAESINDDEQTTGEVFTQVKKMMLVK